jgi:branched-chain amino acid transport system substrate-binding protein
MNKKVAGFGVVIIVLVILVSAFLNQKPAEAVHIGVLVPLSGPGATLGEWMKKGALTAQEEINLAGGINGRPVELVIEDDACTGATAINAYRKMSDIQKIHYFVGPLCAAARIPVLKSAEKDSSILITTGLAVTYGQEGIKAMTFNVLPSVNSIAQKIIAYAFEKIDTESMSLLAVDDEMGKETTLAFTSELAKRGINKPHVETFTKGTKDMRTQIVKIMSDPSDTVFVAGFTPDYALFIKQANELGLKKKIVGLSTVQSADIAQANIGTGLKIYYPHPQETDSASAKKFLEAYKKNDPSASTASPVYLGSGYDAVKVLAYAIEKCGDDVVCANRAISGLNKYPGANGDITFGQNGNVNSAESIEIRVLENGVFERVE